MSSDFRELIRSDLERIPLPPEERWTDPRAHRSGPDHGDLSHVGYVHRTTRLGAEYPCGPKECVT